MSKIKIKHFGPIKEGCQENDGWIEIRKVTVFIGNQGSGKSSVAKLISTLMWLEKSINRDDIDILRLTNHSFKEYFKYQGVINYFQKNTVIEYIGEKLSILYGGPEGYPVIKEIANSEYVVPKIMYISAERNILSTIENVYLKEMPGHLFTLAEEYHKAQKELNGKTLELPIGNNEYEFDKHTETSYIVGSDYRISLLEASSGLQSYIPLYIVSRNLSYLITQNDELLRKNMNAQLSIRMNEEITTLMLDNSITETARNQELNLIRSKYLSKCFVNIIEEPEQNLYPTSQWSMLLRLLAFNNVRKENKLILTTHSPYLINYLTLTVKANELNQKEKSIQLRNKIEDIVPSESTVDTNDLVIYELDEKDGTIKKLDDYKGLPSDENQLNERLGESNELFAKLLEIQHGI